MLRVLAHSIRSHKESAKPFLANSRQFGYTVSFEYEPRLIPVHFGAPEQHPDPDDSFSSRENATGLLTGDKTHPVRSAKRLAGVLRSAERVPTPFVWEPIESVLLVWNERVFKRHLTPVSQSVYPYNRWTTARRSGSFHRLWEYTKGQSTLWMSVIQSVSPVYRLGNHPTSSPDCIQVTGFVRVRVVVRRESAFRSETPQAQIVESLKAHSQQPPGGPCSGDRYAATGPNVSLPSFPIMYKRIGRRLGRRCVANGHLFLRSIIVLGEREKSSNFWHRRIA